MSVLRQDLRRLFSGATAEDRVSGIGVTGSGRELAGVVLGTSVVKNEISCHALAARLHHPGVKTVLEIGGQDSKIIILRDGLVRDFAMNSVCAAGTGSFLEQQANRLGLTLDELGELGSVADSAPPIAARCTVFAESDMIYKQQAGYPRADLVYGLCVSLARNFLATLAKGRRLAPPYIFQGGVAANQGMRRAFREILCEEITVPDLFMHMGAIGAARFAMRDGASHGESSLALDLLEREVSVASIECGECENACRVLEYSRGGDVMGYRGDVCGRYSDAGDPNLRHGPRAPEDAVD
jgi:predicted CoA-substrate-specific enzyme activase